jgi:hypothetical protein
LSARRDGAYEHAITDLIATETGAEFFDHSDRFMSDNEAVGNRILTSNNVEIRAADRRERYANHRFAGAGARFSYLLNADVVLAVKNICSHHVPSF